MDGATVQRSSEATLKNLILRAEGSQGVDTILKSRDIILLTKVCLVKAMVFLSSGLAGVKELA